MKLKKIASLMLAGLMAVSMLAGCSGAPSNGEEGDKEQTVVTSDAATILNNYQDAIDFKVSNEQMNNLTAAVKEAKYTDVKDAKWSFATGAVYNYLSENLPGKAGLVAKVGDANFANKKGESDSVTLIWMEDADKLSQDYVLTEVAQSLAKNLDCDTVVTDGGKQYSASYTGEIAISKVTKTDENGENAASAYYVLVTVTQTVGKTVLTGDVSAS